MHQPKIVCEEIAHRGRFITLKRATYKNRRGNSAQWEYLERRPVVIVFPVASDDNVVIIKQYRIPQGKVVVEIPAGLIDESDASPESAARRELLEETGYTASRFIPITPVTRGAVAAIKGDIHIFLACNAVKIAEPTLEDNEDIETILVPFDNFVKNLVPLAENCELDAQVLAIYTIVRELYEKHIK